MLQFSNLDKVRVMEPETILKNGASPKSQTSRVNKKRIFFAIGACVLVLLCGSCNTSHNAISKNKADIIVGVWKYSPSVTKIITKERFIWTSVVNNKIINSLGGSYTFDGETYTENIEYGTSGKSEYIGTKSTFKVRFEDKKMHIIGTAVIGNIDEVWERVE